jgi:hypothetical protein
MTPTFNQSFLINKIRPNPDLYGPFWICISLIFTIAIAGNIVSFLHNFGSDYKWHNHWFLEKKYYQDSMNYVKEMIPNISFLIITDDVNDSKSLFPNIDCISSDDMKTDFLALLHSKYNIISNSTFSWWSAWLKEKEIVVAPNNWLNYNKPGLGFYPVDMKTKEFIYL